MTMVRTCDWSAVTSGERRDQLRELPPIRLTSTCRFRLASKKHCQLKRRAKDSLTCSEPLAVPTEGVGWWPHATPPSEVDNRSLVLFDRGDDVIVRAGENGIRFLLVSGRPLQEPVAWYGPIVMNTQAELRQAFEELEQGSFLKRGQEA